MRAMPEVRAWVPMRDGVKLAGTFFLPDSGGPFPVIMEALPYRKDDLTASYFHEYRRLRDEGGYAVARIDVRGTGSSQGLAVDEYPAQEQKDLCEVIAWLAGREWCSGSVGMYGASDSGFNSIQVAAEQPPALKAIIAIYATDDRYNDDVHYWGGARRALDFVDYPTYMVAMNALPPTPAIAGSAWREQWKERVDRLEPWVLRWLQEQVQGPYWRHGSLRPDYDRIACPVMMIGGWADGYRNSPWRMMERLLVPKRLLMGPWSHRAAEASLPGPRIDWVPEMLRWWDRWLKDEANGVDAEPPITLFVRRSTKPEPDLDSMRGEWRYEAGWPLERGVEQEFRLSDAVARNDADTLDVRGDVGPFGSISCAGHLPFIQPMDQRPDEAHSLVYDWGPLTDELEILGFPRLKVAVRSSAPVAFLSAKLCDVFEDGTSALVSRGFLNLTHRESHETPEALVPGELYEVTLEMDVTSWVFEKGHRIRLDIAGSDWPNMWPPPAPVTLTIERPACSLTLPVVDGPSPISERPTLAQPSAEAGRAAPPSGLDLENRKGVRGSGDSSIRPIYRIEHDVLGLETRVSIRHGSDSQLDDGPLSIERYDGDCDVSIDDPGQARARGRASYVLKWPQATFRSEVQSFLHSDATTWYLEIELDVGRDGGANWSRRWELKFPRELA
jgi:predicted acyl esterase